MPGCCDPRGCEKFFGTRFARRTARRYGKHGLDKPARQIVEFLHTRGLDGATVLEIGGGVGELQLELLKRGAHRTVNLELSPNYDDEALRLARDAGVQDRIDRRLHDIAADPAAVEPADIVILHRVVCCYPDYNALLTAAARHARRTLVFSHPPRTWLTRAGLGATNLFYRITRNPYRAFVHPPESMVEVLRREGLEPRYRDPDRVWSIVGAVRA